MLALAGGACAQLRVSAIDNSGAYLPGQYDNVPTPYNFAYASDNSDGGHSHQETGDGQGRVQGSYSITLADGRTRTVNYVADENGYRAEVNTNELGTESKNPADVIITSSAITGAEAAVQYGPQAPPERQISYAARPQQIQLRQVNNQIALPSYGTFAGVPGRS